ncbi:MAG: pca operon transcription factor PcaQ [Gemmobacter sp.]|nr:pca operon transcription factor PcaQ [Gemmobacter sp.]
MDRRIKLRHIQAFVEIVRQRSLKKAAERLFLTQPAMSRTLAELEDIAGAALLTRGRAGVVLTAQGELLFRFAQSSLADLERGLAGVAQADTAPQRLALGVLPSVATRLMPGVAAELAGLAPALRLTIADGPHDQMTAQLRGGHLDAVIGRMGAPDTMKGLAFTQLYIESVAIVVRPGHPILADPDLHRIADWPVLWPPPWAAIRPLVDRLLIAQGIPEPQNRIETVSGAFGRVHVRHSDAVWFISEGVVALDLAEGRLTRLPVSTALTEGPVGLMTRAGDRATPETSLLALAIDRALVRLGLG